ncbi:MAG: glycosyltransferase family 2 protein [Candidatus Egerieousia sp.]
MKQKMKIGVIISTYNNPKWLEKTLIGYQYQTRPADEIIIADDGSREETRVLIESFKNRLPIRHVWHEDKGWRKWRILNAAIKASTADYLIFTDQDCIPRKDFIAVHESYAEEGYFLSGGYFKLPSDISEEITENDIASGVIFNYKWLKSKGFKWNFKCTKLSGCKAFTKLMNHITTTKASWNGMNSSTWRKNFIAANGFNNTMLYGGADREFGERLFNMGLKSKQIRYSAITLHLFHKRPYRNQEAWDYNNAVRKQTKKNKTVATESGINQI